MHGPTAGLIIANEEADDAPGLRAELSVTGQSVVEHQARLLARAGLRHIVIHAERLTAGLAAAVDRLRRDGLAVDIARSVADLADRIGPDARVLLIADALVTEPAAATALLRLPGPAILTLPNQPQYHAHELIDPGARWAGVMLTDQAAIRQTAQMLGDWDFCSTLLRRAVQAHAAQVDAAALAPMPLFMAATDAGAALAAEGALAARAVQHPTGLVDRHLFAPLVGRLAAPAMAARIDPAWLRLGMVTAWLAAALLALAGWPGAGLTLMMAAAPCWSLARHLAALGQRSGGTDARWTLVRGGAAALALLALGWVRSGGATGLAAGWTPLALALFILGLVAALISHVHWLGPPPRRPLWLAEPDNMIWLIAPFAAAGWWEAGLIALAGHALASLLAVQRMAAPARAH
ncbi:hypothetical protein GVO57_07120 [Sphingomonas changnyeongensis]|uniref:Uncharacterized protein n=1 Tax=Sphingomonas changnyeongensis TaxID=2698679 RepID=A0A7Z2S9D0_9SPHN|nr:hypothetical protein [Sphingomonas changnyeongensis]QHL90644.1 hypothetical protein GVO57_07120 [Sphingomonas changnyeongensis]